MKIVRIWIAWDFLDQLLDFWMLAQKLDWNTVGAGIPKHVWYSFVWLSSGIRFSNGIPFWTKWWPLCPKPLDIWTKLILFGFQMVWFSNSQDHSYSHDWPFQKLYHWKSELQNFQFSNEFGILMFGIQAPTVPQKCLNQTPESNFSDGTTI